EWSGSESERPRQDLAERLSAWVGVFDAVTLHATHQSIGAAGSVRAPAPPASPSVPAVPSVPSVSLAKALDAQLQQVRAVLTRAMSAPDPGPEPVSRGRLATMTAAVVPAEAVAAVEEPADFAPYRKRYLDHQRNMELMIEPLREHARETLTKASPRLAQLATLDAVWEPMLAGREQRLLAGIPGLMQRRFERLRKTHATVEAPAQWRQPGGWLDGFGQDMRAIALAELDVRLQPVMGLTEAFSSEVEKYQ
ncbi:MAG: hypothetical protein JWQ88_3539, partial [Rhodoferax sp.]|nr:hypothetical protein [Rhodoferax sp.]